MTSYEQGFLTKLAEMGVSPYQAGKIFKVAQQMAAPQLTPDQQRLKAYRNANRPGFAGRAMEWVGRKWKSNLDSAQQTWGAAKGFAEGLGDMGRDAASQWGQTWGSKPIGDGPETWLGHAARGTAGFLQDVGNYWKDVGDEAAAGMRKGLGMAPAPAKPAPTSPAQVKPTTQPPAVKREPAAGQPPAGGQSPVSNQPTPAPTGDKQLDDWNKELQETRARYAQQQKDREKQIADAKAKRDAAQAKEDEYMAQRRAQTTTPASGTASTSTQTGGQNGQNGNWRNGVDYTALNRQKQTNAARDAKRFPQKTQDQWLQDHWAQVNANKANGVQQPMSVYDKNNNTPVWGGYRGPVNRNPPPPRPPRRMV